MKTFLRSIALRYCRYSKSAVLRLKRTSLSESKLGRFFVDVLSFPGDWLTLTIKFEAQFGYLPNVFYPKTFSEFIQREKLFGRKAIKVKLADKIAVRDWVSSRIGSEYLPTLFWTGESLSALDPQGLPDSFVIKPNHTSGRVKLIHDKASTNWESVVAETEEWLKDEISLTHGEWQYRWIKPRLLVEELLSENGCVPPNDYKFWCYDGRVRFLQVFFDRRTNYSKLTFDRNLQELDCEPEWQVFKGKFELPPNIKEALILAEVLSKGFTFVRVDFYFAPGPVFSEMTFAPASGYKVWRSFEWDRIACP